MSRTPQLVAIQKGILFQDIAVNPNKDITVSLNPAKNFLKGHSSQFESRKESLNRTRQSVFIQYRISSQDVVVSLNSAKNSKQESAGIQ